ncbi:MAG: hypothetical protein HBSIN02_00650 [Bacteroidia bacterium]|nr:MAG: hypothetical protein HBSIN02_00650 [Bacteroidia bacterium]
MSKQVTGLINVTKGSSGARQSLRLDSNRTGEESPNTTGQDAGRKPGSHGPDPMGTESATETYIRRLRAEETGEMVV